MSASLALQAQAAARTATRREAMAGALRLAAMAAVRMSVPQGSLPRLTAAREGLARPAPVANGPGQAAALDIMQNRSSARLPVPTPIRSDLLGEEDRPALVDTQAGQARRESSLSMSITPDMDSDLIQRVAVLESRVDASERAHSETNEKLDEIIRELSRYKGMIGGALFLISALVGAAELLKGWIGEHWRG